MFRNSDADRRGYLPLRFCFLIVHAHIHAGLLADDRLGVACSFAARTFGLGFDAHGAQCVAGSGRVAGGGIAAALLFLVQFAVDHVGGLVILLLVFLVSVLFLVLILAVAEIFACQELVGLALQIVRVFAQLVQVTGNIRAHGGGDCLCGVLAVAGSRDIRAACHGGLSAHHRGDIRIRDIDRGGSADRCLSADGKRAGGGLRHGVFGGGHVQVAVFLPVAFAVALGGHHGTCRNSGGNHVIQNVQRNGSVHTVFLGVFRIRLVLDRIGTRRGSNIFLMVGRSADRQFTGGHGPLADFRLHGAAAVNHGEGRADADTLAGVVFGSGFGIFRVRLLAFLKGRQDTGHFAVRHGEGIDVFILVADGESKEFFLFGIFLDEFHIVVLAVLVCPGITEGIQFPAFALRDVDLNGFTRTGNRLAILLLPVLDRYGYRAFAQRSKGFRLGKLIQHFLRLQ